MKVEVWKDRNRSKSKMELRVNDYVRTNKGTIDKLTKENIMTYEVALMGFGEKPIKSSPNIIDLIEVGDYVNGYLVIEKDINNELRYIDLKDRNMKYVKYLDIKSIVTKEQFKNIEYEVKQ